jgi:beta-lactamase regulating signal transducer with metallopeptidase domain
MTLQLIVSLGLPPALAALLTYLLHSVIWGAAAGLAVRPRAFSPSTQSYLWLAALLGPLVTSALAITSSSSRAYVQEVELPSLAGLTHSPLLAADGGASKPARVHARTTELGAPAATPVLIALAAAALLGALQFALSLVAFRRRLRDRVQIDDPRLLQRLDRLRSRTRLSHVTLTQSAAIDVPLVLGRSEICLPVASLSAASHAEIDAVLAHELAHLTRRDGVVFPLVGLVQSLCWLQPLNHWVAARFRQAAELACDDRAVELTGDRLALAHALARVAQHAKLPTRAPLLPAMTRARTASAVVTRVRRLVRAQERTKVRGHAGWAAACCSVFALATVSLSVRAARPPLPRPAADVSAAATERIAALMELSQQLETELASAGESEPRMLELQQQLRHARETAAWIERTSSGRRRP